MDIIPIPCNLIRRVLNRVYSPGKRMLSHTDRVPQTPSQAEAISVKIVAFSRHIG